MSGIRWVKLLLPCKELFIFANEFFIFTLNNIDCHFKAISKRGSSKINDPSKMYTMWWKRKQVKLAERSWSSFSDVSVQNFGYYSSPQPSISCISEQTLSLSGTSHAKLCYPFPQASRVDVTVFSHPFFPSRCQILQVFFPQEISHLFLIMYMSVFFVSISFVPSPLLSIEFSQSFSRIRFQLATFFNSSFG